MPIPLLAEKPYHLPTNAANYLGDDARHRPARRVLPYLPPPKLANLFSLSSTPYCKPQPVISVDISFFLRYTIPFVLRKLFGERRLRHVGQSTGPQRAGRSARAVYLRAGTCRPARCQPGRHLESRHCPACGRHPIEAITNRGYACPHGADLLNATPSQRC